MTLREMAHAFARWTKNFFDDVPPEEDAEPQPTQPPPQQPQQPQQEPEPQSTQPPPQQQPQPQPDSSEAQRGAAEILLSDLMRGHGIRRRRDLTALFKPGVVVGGTVTALTLFLITALLLLFGPTVGEVLHAAAEAVTHGTDGAASGAESDAVLLRLAPGFLGILTAVGMTVTATRTVARTVRRRTLVRSVNAVVRNLGADPAMVREFFRRRYDFEWRKSG